MTLPFNSLPRRAHIAVFGASGGIGAAFVRNLSETRPDLTVHAISRSLIEAKGGVTPHTYSPTDETSIAKVAEALAPHPLHLTIVAIGTLHDGERQPEKALRQWQMDAFLETLRINAGVPTLIAKHLMPQLKAAKHRSVFAALSARVGSISDNRLGGWHSYRASKAALNQLTRNIAIELAQRNKEGIAVTLHPGTVDTSLSAPFQRGVPEGKLFTPDYSASHLLHVIDRLQPTDSGRCFDYAGKEISP